MLNAYGFYVISKSENMKSNSNQSSELYVLT